MKYRSDMLEDSEPQENVIVETKPKKSKEKIPNAEISSKLNKLAESRNEPKPVKVAKEAPIDYEEEKRLRFAEKEKELKAKGKLLAPSESIYAKEMKEIKSEVEKLKTQKKKPRKVVIVESESDESEPETVVIRKSKTKPIPIPKPTDKTTEAQNFLNNIFFRNM
jgi:hypothetical protein